MENIKSTLRFIDYYVNKVEFYNNEHFEDAPVEIDFKISRDIEYMDDEDNTFLVTLNSKIFENPEDNNYPFNMDISLTGLFQLDRSDAEDREKFAEINAIAILFPYLRSIVSTYTANANVSPLILPPINVVNMIRENEVTN